MNANYKNIHMFLIGLIFFISPYVSLGQNDSINTDFNINNDFLEKVITYTANNSSIQLKCLTSSKKDTVNIGISFPFIDAVNIQMETGDQKLLMNSGNSFKLLDNAQFILISTDSISLKISKKIWGIWLYRNNEEIISQSANYSKNNGFNKFQIITSKRLDEHYYGFGEKFNGLDQKGKTIVMELNDAYMSDDDSTYKSIPFFLSSTRYGLLVNSNERVVFNMGNKKESEYDFENPDSFIDYYIFLNKNPIEVVSQYTSISGRPPLIPKWSLEPWLSRRRITGWNSPENAEADIDMIINNGFRLGVVLWEGIRRMFVEPYVVQMNSLSDKWHTMGIKQVSWDNTGHIYKNSPFIQNHQKNYFIKYSDSSFCVGARGKTNYYLNPTDSNAMEWWKHTFYEHRFRSKNGFSAPEAWNLDGLKLDFCELFPKNDSDLLNINKSTGMHNQHSVLFSEHIYNWIQTVKPEGGITWVRGGGLGLQKVGFAWGGDRGRTFDQLKGTVMASLGVSICGVSLIGHDLGGYRGGNSEIEKKVYIRGVQYATFSPAFHDHGSAPAPWEQDEYGRNNYSFYSRVRYNILPYLYHYVNVSHLTGTPIMRSLFMHSPDDSNTFSIEDEYFLGDDVLVAPILNELNERKIYLPEGDWIDLWNQKEFKGKQFLDFKTALNRIPVFVKKGAILPLELNNEMQFGGIFPQEQKNNLLLTFRLFNGTFSQTKIYRKNFIDIKKDEINGKIIVHVNNIDENFGLIVDGVLPEKILVNGIQMENISSENFAINEDGWKFDKSTNQLFVKIKAEDNTTKYKVELLKFNKIANIDEDIKTSINSTPEISKIIGWDKSIELYFTSLSDEESYIVKYWNDEKLDDVKVLDVFNSPVTIPDLQNGREYNFTISSVTRENTRKESSVKKGVPSVKKPFFVLDSGKLFINTDHFIDKTTKNDTIRSYTYGILAQKSAHHSVWLKMSKGHTHFLYNRWYKIGEIGLNVGDNFFELQLLQQDTDPYMLYLTSDPKDRPFLKSEQESEFIEKSIKIINETILQFN